MKQFLILICLIFVTPVWAEKEKLLNDPHVAFVEQVSNSIISLLKNKSDSKQQERNTLREILNQKFAMAKIGKFSLGRYWRRANKQEKREYLKYFKEMMVSTYVEQFNNYKDQTIDVEYSKAGNKGGIIVVSKVIQQDGPPIDLHWFLRRSKDGKLQIFDVIIEGVSMAQTWRSDIGARFQNYGGTMRGLNEHLKQQAGQI